MDSHMAGPIYLKLSGIDMGHSVHVFGQKKITKVIRNRLVYTIF